MRKNQKANSRNLKHSKYGDEQMSKCRENRGFFDRWSQSQSVKSTSNLPTFLKIIVGEMKLQLDSEFDIKLRELGFRL